MKVPTSVPVTTVMNLPFVSNADRDRKAMSVSAW